MTAIVGRAAAALPAEPGVGTLLQLAVERNLDVEKLGQLIGVVPTRRDIAQEQAGQGVTLHMDSQTARDMLAQLLAHRQALVNDPYANSIDAHATDSDSEMTHTAHSDSGEQK